MIAEVRRIRNLCKLLAGYLDYETLLIFQGGDASFPGLLASTLTPIHTFNA